MTGTCAQCGASLSPWDTSCPSCGQSTAAPGQEAPADRDAMAARLAEVARPDYEIVGELGHGGMGWVFLARDRKLGRLAALKVLPPLGALRAGAIERFRREAETAAKLSHPNIVPIYGVGGDMETPYYAMAYVEGESLADRMAREGALPVSEALRLAREVGSALAHAHRHDVVHRDVKPQNVMLERETGRALVTDFGIARALKGERVTATGIAVGTPGYMAPEQAAGAPDVDVRADQYSFAVVLFEMLTGVRFESVDRGEWPISGSAARRAALRAKPDLPGHLVDTLARALSPRREDRWPDMDGLLAAVAGAEGELLPRRRARLGPMAAAGLGATLLGATAMLLMLLIRSGTSPARVATSSQRVLALMPFDGDSAAADSLLPALRYQFRGFTNLRVADPRVFAPSRGSDPAGEEVRSSARRAGAAWVLHGFAGRTGGNLELLVRLVNVGSGRVADLGRVTTPGVGVAAADSVVLVLARSPAGRELGLAAGQGASAASLEVVRAYAEAEEAFRRGDYSAAVEGYDRVLASDSTFANAAYQRFLAELQQEPSEEGLRRAVDAMRRIVPSVGELERGVLTAYLVLFDSGDVARAEARLREVVARDSTFLDGWFALGEVRYHFGALAGLAPESAASAFEKALALWPDAGPALMHLIGLRLWLGREDESRDAIRLYLSQDSTSPLGRTVKIGETVLFGSPRAKRAVLDRVGELDARVLRFGAITGATVARDRADLANVRLALDALLAPGRPTAWRREAARFLPAAYATEGRWRDASRAREMGASLGDADASRWEAVAYLVGAGSAAAAERVVAARLSASSPDLAERAVDLWLAGMVSLARGDTANASRRLGALEAMASGEGPPAGRGFRAALAGAIAEAAGDTTLALARYREGLASLEIARTPFMLLHSQWLPRLRLARLELATGDTAAALAHLEAQDFLSAFSDQIVRGPVWFQRGRVLAAHGDRAGAERYLRRAAELLRYAEPPWDAVRDSALRSLELIGSAPR